MPGSLWNRNKKPRKRLLFSARRVRKAAPERAWPSFPSWRRSIFAGNVMLDKRSAPFSLMVREEGILLLACDENGWPRTGVVHRGDPVCRRAGGPRRAAGALEPR